MQEKDRPLIGFGLPQLCNSSEFDVQRLRGLVASAEQSGLHSLWVTDQPFGPGEALEPLTLMGFAAALAPSMIIGAAVVIAPGRHPVHLARAFATLDQLTKGRLVVGLGLGGAAAYEALGLPQRRRADRLLQSVRLMRSVWTEDRVDFEGPFWSVHGHSPPRVVQTPSPPIWLAATTERALRRTVGEADGWIGAGTTTSASFIELAAFARAALVESQRQRSTFTIAKRVFIGLEGVSSDPSKLVRQRSQAIYGDPDVAQRSAFIGTASDCALELRRLVRAGADLLILNPMFDEEAHLRMLADEVIPAI